MIGHTRRMDVREVVVSLNWHLGPTLVAALAGTTDREAPVRWEFHSDPTPEQERRLLAARAVWDRLTQLESEDVARAWLIGDNPALGSTAITALREDRLQEVMQAVDHFAAGRRMT